MKKKIIVLIMLTVVKLGAQITDFKHIDFTLAENTAKLYAGEPINNLPLLTHKLTFKLKSDVEKFRAIYYWVCHNIKNDYHTFRKIKTKRRKLQNDSTAFYKWQNSYRKKVFNRLLNHKKTVCTGYAYLIEQMAFIANIECVMINGYARNSNTNVDTLEFPNHTWNAVKLDNKWYLCDPTWSSGFIDTDYTFLRDFNNGYFLTVPSLFAKNHHPLNKKWLLGIKQSKESFISTPIIYDVTFEYGIMPIEPKKLYMKVTEKTPISFTFKTTQKININKISLVYYNENNKEVELKTNNLSYEKGILKFNTIITKEKTYDIHVKINNEVISSYSVYVNRKAKS